MNLGLDALLAARQILAHSGTLSNIYFLPLASNTQVLMVTGAAILILLALATSWGFGAAVRWWRAVKLQRSPTLGRIRSLTSSVLAAGTAALASAALFLPGGPLFESLALRLLFTVTAAFIGVAAVLSILLTYRTWREESTCTLVRVQVSLAAIAAPALALALATFWVPLAWRSSDRGIERLAQRS